MKKLNIIQNYKLKKLDKMLINGLKQGLVFPYPDSLFDVLRPYNVAGLPASILLFENELCNGFCYDRSLIMQLPLQNCRVVHADIEHLRLTSSEGISPEHSFVETQDFGDGKTWVIDTSVGLIYDKDYYYKIEKPKINHILTKEDCMSCPSVREVVIGDFEKDKYALPLYLPFVENAIKSSRHIGTIIYRDKVLDELDKFKKAINYEGIKAEIDADMKLMWMDPNKLDEKFGIVRDKFGREISRNGEPNPYYISPEEIEEREEKYKSFKGDKQKEIEFFAKMREKEIARLRIEDAKKDEEMKSRIEQILANPTANFYEEYLNPNDNTCDQDSVMGE